MSPKLDKNQILKYRNQLIFSDETVKSALGQNCRFLEPQAEVSHNSLLFSLQKHSDQITITPSVNEKQYNVTVEFDQSYGYTEEFFFKFLEDMFNKVVIQDMFPEEKWKRVPDAQETAIYCPELAFQLQQHDVEIWPGFFY